MSRIVFLSPPAHGHLNPVLPVLRELVRRGEQVACFNTDEFRPQIERTGATFRPYRDSDLTSDGIAAALDDGNLARVTALILRSTEQLVPSLLDELSHDPPDLVVFDSIALWGRMAATVMGVRTAASISHLVMDERHMRWLDLLRMLRLVVPELPAILRPRHRLIKRHGSAFPSGTPLFPMRGGLNLVFTTRELQAPTPIVDGTFRFVGPSIDPDTRGETLDLGPRGALPLVYVALGTVHPMRPDFFRTCVDAFSAIDAQFLLSVGRSADVAGFGTVPPNFIVRASVPQLQVLERASAFVTHAGINGVHEALYYGVPLVLVPQHYEQLLNARSVAARGAGVVIDVRVRRRPVEAGPLRAALTAVLSEPRFRDAAGTLQQSMRASGGYLEAATLLQHHASDPAGAAPRGL
jgi:MGT family glycosyltransferase